MRFCNLKTCRWTFAQLTDFQTFLVSLGFGFPKPFDVLDFVIKLLLEPHILQLNRDPSAYPEHYIQALAFGHISPPYGLRLHLRLLPSLLA
jgi:hypothetical protein